MVHTVPAKRPTSAFVGRNVVETAAKSGKTRTGATQRKSCQFPADPWNSSVKGAQLKIVVSPVRVRVSPSQARNPASMLYFLLAGVTGSACGGSRRGIVDSHLERRRGNPCKSAKCARRGSTRFGRTCSGRVLSRVLIAGEIGVESRDIAVALTLNPPAGRARSTSVATMTRRRSATRSAPRGATPRRPFLASTRERAPARTRGSIGSAPGRRTRRPSQRPRRRRNDPRRSAARARGLGPHRSACGLRARLAAGDPGHRGVDRAPPRKAGIRPPGTHPSATG